MFYKQTKDFSQKFFNLGYVVCVKAELHTVLLVN